MSPGDMRIRSPTKKPSSSSSSRSSSSDMRNRRQQQRSQYVGSSFGNNMAPHEDVQDDDSVSHSQPHSACDFGTGGHSCASSPEVVSSPRNEKKTQPQQRRGRRQKLDDVIASNETTAGDINCNENGDGGAVLALLKKPSPPVRAARRTSDDFPYDGDEDGDDDDDGDDDCSDWKTDAACKADTKDRSSVTVATTTIADEIDDDESTRESSAFTAFRMHYLIVHIAIMLADGLQGTHLYVLYEGYGYTVASLYCLGFVSGALSSPFIGPIVDHKIGRRTAAIVYCVLEIIINLMEQYSLFAGLVLSRVVGGITTNLLFTVFESWLVTEHRKRGFGEDQLEIVLRDSVVASNLSAIASGCLAHFLAGRMGNGGPFAGAVGCTLVALVLVATRWEENFGHHDGDGTCYKDGDKDKKEGDEVEVSEMRSIRCHMSEAFQTIVSDSKISRIGVIQGLTEGALQTFVFLWSPVLRHFALHMPPDLDPSSYLGIASNGEPEYGLIFGAFMACGALGGLCEPTVRKAFVSMLRKNDRRLEQESRKPRSASSESPLNNTCKGMIVEIDMTSSAADDSSKNTPNSNEEKPAAVELLASLCFLGCAALLAVPVFVNPSAPYAFSASLAAFLSYEILVGLYMPCEGVIRSAYMPNDTLCSVMTMLRVIVNVSVAVGVISTNYIPFSTAFAVCSLALLVAAMLQLSLVTREDWASLVALFVLPRRNTTSSSPVDVIENVPDAKQLMKMNAGQFLSASTYTVDRTLSSVSGATMDKNDESSLSSHASYLSESDNSCLGKHVPLREEGLRRRPCRTPPS